MLLYAATIKVYLGHNISGAPNLSSSVYYLYSTLLYPF